MALSRYNSSADHVLGTSPKHLLDRLRLLFHSPRSTEYWDVSRTPSAGILRTGAFWAPNFKLSCLNLPPI